jgi:hypothetical protein
MKTCQTYIVPLRTRTYRIFVDNVKQRDDSVYRYVSCNGTHIHLGGTAIYSFPKSIQVILRKELEA